MTLDADVVRGRCAEIDECLVRLERVAQGSREQFLANRDLQDIVSYRLLVYVYWKLDYDRVWDIVQQDVGDLRRLASAIAALV